jgi:hypothetical protein
MPNLLLNRGFHQVFYSILYVVTSPVVQLLIYQVLKYRHAWYGLGLFHLLVIMYFPSMLVSLVYLCLQISENYVNFQRSPFFLSIGQLFCIGVLTAMQISMDFFALTVNTARDVQRQSTEKATAWTHWDLPRFLMIQLMMSLIFTPLFN